MPATPPSANISGASSLQTVVWRGLRGAAAWAEDRSVHSESSAERAFSIDADGALVPLSNGAEAAWLHWSAGGWRSANGAPPEARALLDLYLPLCGARPWAIAHLGQSLDGHIATSSGDSYYVTGPDNLVHLHRLRALCDAVIVGAGTVARDDPQLTVRHVEGESPVRVVLDPRRRLDASRRVFADDSAATLLACDENLTREPGPGGAELLGVPMEHGRMRLDVLLARLRERGLRSVLVEGGGATVSSFLAANLLDRLQVAVAPLVTGSGTPGVSLPARDRISECLRPSHRVFAMGADVLFDCDLRAAAEPPREHGFVVRVT